MSRLLVGLGAVDPQDLRDKKPEIEKVLINLRRKYDVYFFIVKQNHFEDINQEYVRKTIHYSRIALERENMPEFYISRYGDLSDKLPQEKLRKILTLEFAKSNIEIIICHGNVSIPPEQLRIQIISENH